MIMSTLAPTAPAPVTRAPVAGSRLSFAGLLKAEWISLTSLRGTHLSIWIGAALGFGLTAGMAVMWGLATSRPDSPLPVEAVPSLPMVVVNGYIVAIAVAIVLGAAAYAKEHATGSLRTQLAAAPRRVPTLAAKAIVVGATLFAFAVVGFALCLAACAAIFSAFDLPVALDDPLVDVLLPLLGLGLGAALTSTFALGVAAMLRSETWAITLTIVFVFVFPTLLISLPWQWAADAAEYVFGTTVQALPDLSAGVTGDYLRDVVLSIAWAAAAFVGGAIVMNRRDA